MWGSGRRRSTPGAGAPLSAGDRCTRTPLPFREQQERFLLKNRVGRCLTLMRLLHSTAFRIVDGAAATHTARGPAFRVSPRVYLLSAQKTGAGARSVKTTGALLLMASPRRPLAELEQVCNSRPAFAPLAATLRAASRGDAACLGLVATIAQQLVTAIAETPAAIAAPKRRGALDFNFLEFLVATVKARRETIPRSPAARRPPRW